MQMASIFTSSAQMSGYLFATSRKQRVINPPVSRSTFGFSISVTRLRPVFFAYSNASLQMLVQLCTLMMRVESATFSSPLLIHFFICFVLCRTADRAKQSARRVLERLHRAIQKRVPFCAPKLPPDIAGNVLGVEFHSVQHDPRRFHDIVAHAVAGHPCNSVFSHRKAILSAGVTTRKRRKFWDRGLRGCNGSIVGSTSFRSKINFGRRDE